MSDEHESAAAAWLDLPETKREMAIVQERFPRWTSYEVAAFVLSMATYIALEVYGAEEEKPSIDLRPPIELRPDDDDDTEGWKPKGWTP